MLRPSAALLLLAVVGCTTVNPGYVGIKVNMYGGNRGVQDMTLVTGRVAYNPFTTRVLEWPTFVQTAAWTSNPQEGRENRNDEITFNSKEGLVISADVSLSYQLDPSKIPHFYVQFRTDNLDVFTHGYLRNVARDAFNEEAAHLTAEELYSTKKEDFLTAVRARINASVDTFGVRLDQFGFIGAPRLPQNVVEALNGKIQAIQDAQTALNKLQQIKAEAEQRVAAAEGEAQANALLTRSLTPELIRWRTLMIQQDAVAKWNGVLPVYTTGGGSNVPLITLPGATTAER